MSTSRTPRKCQRSYFIFGLLKSASSHTISEVEIPSPFGFYPRAESNTRTFLLSLFVAFTTLSPIAYATKLDRKAAERRIADIESAVQAKQATGTVIVRQPPALFMMAELPVEDAIFVIDTSGSMRDSTTGLLWDAVIEHLAVFLKAMPKLHSLAVFDAEGRKIYHWPATHGSNVTGMPDATIRELLLVIKSYRTETYSGWSDTLAYILDRHARSLKKNAVEIFFFTDEITKDTNSIINLANQLTRRLSSYSGKLNVVRAHNAMLRERRSSLPPLKTARALEIYGRYLAEATGGAFYYFEHPRDTNTPEIALITRLVMGHPDQQWAVRGDPDDIATLNQQLKAKLELEHEPIILLENEEELPARCAAIVDIEPAFREEESARYFVTLRRPDETTTREYLARLHRSDDLWVVNDWKLLWEIDHPYSPLTIGDEQPPAGGETKTTGIQ